MSNPVRQAAILRLVRDNAISTQGELVEALREEGHDVVQTTVSRDVHELGLVKVRAPSGRLVYAAPGTDDADRRRAIGVAMRRYATAVERAGPLVVVSTPSGYASALAQAIDEGAHPGIAGTIAGDNTIFLAPREGTHRAASATSCASISCASRGQAASLRSEESGCRRRPLGSGRLGDTGEGGCYGDRRPELYLAPPIEGFCSSSADALRPATTMVMWRLRPEAGFAGREATLRPQWRARKKGARGGDMVSPTSKRIALLLPGIGVVVVAVALPEARLIRRRGARSRGATWRSSRSTSRGSRGGAASRAPV